MKRKRVQTLTAGVAVVIVVALIGFVLHSVTAGNGSVSGRAPIGMSDTAKQQIFSQKGGIRVESAVACPQSRHIVICAQHCQQPLVRSISD